MADGPLIDLAVFEKSRAALGADFVRILGYFLEDGEKSVAAIEAAFRSRSAAGIVRPAHTLKGEAGQIGAEAVALLAEAIEAGARRAVEIQDDPADLLVPIAKLRPLWTETVAILERETNPLVQRTPKPGAAPAPATFGRDPAANQRFGRF